MSKIVECSAFASGETEHECPDEGENLKLPITVHHAEFLGVSFEESGWKEDSEATHKTWWRGLSGHMRYLFTRVKTKPR